MFLSNKTIYFIPGVYTVLLHKVQQYVSAHDNGHLQVINGIFIKRLHKIYIGCIHGAGRRGVERQN